MTRKGIDVSHWQGTIDWNKIKKAGIEFAIIKAGGSDAGFYTDSKWEANYKGAKAAGIPIGAYYFVGKDCVTAAAGKADAERFLQILKGNQLEYPVYMDNEAQPASAKAGITEATIAFCETMEDAGYFVGIYGSAVSGFKERMDDTKLTSFAHWVAQYASKCSYKGDYGIWQYSSKGSVDGISGNVDMDYAYVDYPSIIQSGGFNGFTKATSDDSKPATPAPVTPAKTVDELAQEVLDGKWGNGTDRKERLDLIFDKYPKELLPFDFETYFNSEINCQIVTTNCLTGKAEYMTEDSDNDRLMKLCRASSSMPLLTPIVNIDNVPYLDGGLADSVPIRRAQQMENEKIVVILTKNQGYRKSVLSPTMQRVYKRAYKSYPNLIRTIFRRSFEYNKTMNYLDQLEKRGEIFILRPQVKPVSRLERNKETLHAFYEHGYKYTERKFDDLMEYLEK